MKGISIAIIIVAVLAIIGAAFVFASGILTDKDYTIQYDMNGGIGSIDTQIVHNDDTFVVSECSGIKFGYSFDGWYSDGVKYYPGQILNAKSDFNFIASWIFERNVVDSGECGEDSFWALYDDGELEIAGKRMNDTWGLRDSPWSGKATIKKVVIDEGIINVGASSFAFCPNLTDVTLPSSLKRIGSSCFFECNNLTSVSLKKGIDTIGQNSFFGCSSLSSIYLPSTVKTIEKYAFHSCVSLENVELPSDLEIIGLEVFCQCYKLSISRLPEGLVELGERAFFCCESIKEITIPRNVRTIGDGPFSHCSNLQWITVDPFNQYYESDNDGILFDKGKNKLIQFPSGKHLDEYIVPDSVRTIGQDAFYYSTLKKVVLPPNVSIGYRAFWDVISNEVVIPVNVSCVDGFNQVFSAHFFDFDGTTELNDNQIPGYTYIKSSRYEFVRSL